MSLDSTHTSISLGLGNALPVEALQETVERDPESKLTAEVFFSSVFLPMARFLDPDSLSKLSCTNRAWRDFTRSEALWQMLSERDFGKRAVSSAGGSYRDAYIENFFMAREVIKALPRGKQLLDDSGIDDLRGKIPHKLCGLLSLSCLDEYIRGLSKGELGYVFCRSMEIGFIPILRAIIESPRFNEIDANNGIGYGFLLAAGNGQIDAMTFIKQHPRFDEISVNGLLGLGDAFETAAGNGQIESMQLIMHLPQFEKIGVNRPRVLGFSFLMAAINGRIDVMEFIMHLTWFDERDPNVEKGLGVAFHRAAAADHIEAMQFIMQFRRFGELDVNGQWGLGAAFRRAVEFNSMNAVKLIMQNPRFVEINGYIDAMKLIMQDPRFTDLANEAWGGLGHAFVIAAQMGRIDIIDIIMDDPGFVEINKATVISAIKQSSISVGLHILKKWPVAYLTGMFVKDCKNTPHS